MIRLIVALTAIAAASACARDLRTNGVLEPVEAGFRWRTYADATFPESSAKAEKARLGELANTLAQNNACPGGYTVTNRQATKKQDGILGDGYDVFYDIRCR